ncbi:MAG TPA: alkaline phosphatase family protein [Solirubrobacteraceae bacterium]|nr:alkaline phosphatase family protein [Solirubrobacteraceae bacterium]
MAAADDLEALQQINHIVVLMMENRSFDHMLGYLTKDGMSEVNGLKGDESNPDVDGTACQVWEFGDDQTAFHIPGTPAADKSLDPCHSPRCVSVQLGGGNTGFVKNFVTEKSPPAAWRKLPMGHYTSDHLPVYDHLARQFCVCDAWHSSIPGDTWPNRLYSLTGTAAPSVASQQPFFKELVDAVGAAALDNVPLYNLAAFTRQLADGQWRWYSHDPATLRAADPTYRDPTDFKTDNFSYFDRTTISLATQGLEGLLVGQDSFLDDAAKGNLRSVSWIDPNFIDLSVLDPNSNDDHPPSDVLAGQQLALDVYHALVNSPNWNDTLLVITYDEHGGFYDHVAPPRVNDGSGYATYGLRVPALVVGPRVKNFVCHDFFDHTALIKTILLRFAADPAAVTRMGARVAASPHLGGLLGAVRTDLADHGDLHAQLDAWRARARALREVQPGGAPAAAGDGAGQPLALNAFAQEFGSFALAMRASGLAPGHP